MPKALAAALAALALAGCATFKGPGEFKESAAPSEKGAPAAGTEQSTAAAPEATAESTNFDWPVQEARISRGFKASRKAHWGVDLANRKGTPVMASERGRVIYVGREFHGYGNLIVIEHNNEWATLYAHLQKFLVREGEAVKQGQPIGLMGRTGHASGVHLHFEIRQNRVPVNPLAYLPRGF